MPNNSPRRKQAPKREQIVDYLTRQGGKIVSDDGRGLTVAMAKAVGYRDVTVLNNMLARLEKEGVISRDVRGRRTFAISLRGRSARAGANGKRPAAKRATGAAQVRRAAASGTRATRAIRSSGAGSGRTQLASTVTELAGRLGEALAALAVENESLVRRIEQLEKSGGTRRAAGASRAPARRRATATRSGTTRGRRAA